MVDTIQFRASMSHRCKHGAPKARAGGAMSMTRHVDPSSIDDPGRGGDWAEQCQAPFEETASTGAGQHPAPAPHPASIFASFHAQVVASLDAEGVG